MGGVLGGLFANKKDTTQNTNSNQSGSTQNNLWNDPNLQNFLQGYNQQYAKAPNFNVATDPNITGAAAAQSGVAGGLQPAFQTANNIGSEGITTANVNKFMSPYTQKVVDATATVQNQQNKQGLSALNGSLASKAALGNNVGTQAAYLSGVAPAQNAALAGLYNAGYGQAVNTAGQDAALKLQGAGTAGSLTGAATGANTAWGNLGQYGQAQSNFNAITPYSLYNQGIQGYQNAGQLAGTNYTGQSTGTSVGQGTETPSTGSILGGLAGAAISAWSDERIKENIKPIGETFDGQPIYKYNLIGDPKTQIGLMAQEVEKHTPEAVDEVGGIKMVNYDQATKGAEQSGMKPYAGGGEVGGMPSAGGSLIDKVLHASQALRQFRDGGDVGMKGYDGGGYVSDWNTQTVAPSTGLFSGFDAKKAGSGLSAFGSNMGKMSNDNNSGADAIARQQSELSQGMSKIMPHYDGGGAVPNDAYVPPRIAPYTGEAAPQAEPSFLSKAYSAIGKPFSGGIWDGEAATPMQRAGMALTQIGNGPFAGFGKSMLEQQGVRFEEMKSARERAAMLGRTADGQDTLARQQALGKIDGAPTIAAQQFKQSGDIAKGTIDGADTLAAKQLAETTRIHNRPTWGHVGMDRYGQPQYGWIDPNKETITSPSGSNVNGIEAQDAMANSGLAGDEFLKTLPKPLGDRVKAIAEGREMPSGFGSRAPYWLKMGEMVSQYDPSFDMVNFKARQAARKEFTAGKDAANVASFNTTIAHLDTLDKAVDGLKNTDYPMWNSIANAVGRNTSPDTAAALNKFNTAKIAVVDELTRAFRGSSGNVHDIVEWEKNLNAADSPKALRAAINQGIELLHGRIEAVGDKYNRGMGTTKDPVELLSPKAQSALKRMKGMTSTEFLPRPEGGEIPPDSIAKLNAHPELSKSFEETYGAGSAMPHMSNSPAASAAKPPVPSAKQAPDGLWYVPDPNRPGKFLRVGE